MPRKRTRGARRLIPCRSLPCGIDLTSLERSPVDVSDESVRTLILSCGKFTHLGCTKMLSPIHLLAPDQSYHFHLRFDQKVTFSNELRGGDCRYLFSMGHNRVGIRSNSGQINTACSRKGCWSIRIAVELLKRTFTRQRKRKCMKPERELAEEQSELAG